MSKKISDIAWKDLGFEIEITGDGSPSLRLLEGVKKISSDKELSDQYRGESMHHSGGAASETEIIYGQVVDEVFKKINSPRLTVVGLGLGYIEFCIARSALKENNTNFFLQSFESVEDLKNLFLHYISNSSELSNSVKKTYDLLLSFLSGSFEEHERIKSLLWEKYNQDQFIISSSLGMSAKIEKPFHGICYDAFSSKTSPDLWDEAFLEFFLTHADESCLFSTYACRGSLKRSLQKSHFQVEVREGFMGKRNSTRARRGLFAL